MGKCVEYSIIAVIGLAVGAVIAGVAVFYIAAPQQMSGPMAGKCMLFSSRENVHGIIHFQQESADESLVITANITGLAAGKHGFHIHTLGSQGGDCAMASGHYNPHEMNHGGPTVDDRHIGDLGNIQSPADASTVVQIKDSVASLFGEYSIYGRSIVIHEKEDDLDSATSTGNAGSRVACCTIMHS